MARKSYLQSYLAQIRGKGNHDMADSIESTALAFSSANLETFSFAEHKVGLLFGNVQAGKTAQMFGIMCAAADDSFPIFILLTTDNVALHKQTYDRVVKDLSCCEFCICGEQDRQKFVDNGLEKPAIIILKKNSRVLLQWYNTLAASSFVKGNALFIVDDEADAASPNTLVNKNRLSTINTRLMNIKDYSIGSIYLQVTGTPQALLLQSSVSEFKPAFTCYFEPGKSYLGGDFFFGEDIGNCIRFISSGDDDESDDLFDAIICHLISSAQLNLNGCTVSNFVIHPGVKKQSHLLMKKSVENKLNKIEADFKSEEIQNKFKEEYNNQTPSGFEKAPFENVISAIENIIQTDTVNILVMNGDTAIKDEQYSDGCNIIIGGNILGRGVTFPRLQTIYYTRTAKKPQADTMWQHSRMFGYDRDAGLMNVFITKPLYKLFSDINAANNSIIYQVEKGLDKIQLFYPEGLNPTRKNVIDIKMVNLVAGGANYYPDNPDNDSIETISEMLEPFESSGHYQVSAKLILEILNHIIPSEDFPDEAFKSVIKAKIIENPFEQAVLIVRREREVTQGTGSLLSPNDRALGKQFDGKIVLTMYQIKGSMGWKQDSIWVPNIKLPEFINYYDVH